MVKDFYDILGVAKDAGDDQIRRAYRRQAKSAHPDASGTTESAGRFREVEQAYETLRDRDKRAEYDRRLREQAAPPGGLRTSRQPVAPFARPASFPDLFGPLLFGRRRPGSGGPWLEVVLSPDEARRGVVLPVDVPLLSPCPDCAGVGSWFWDPLGCAVCGGTGAVRIVREVSLEIPPGVRHGEQFRCGVMAAASPSFLVRVLVQPA